MQYLLVLLIFVVFSNLVMGYFKNFYVGMLKKTDVIVASDRLFKDRKHFGINYATYGRIFKCPITYLLVVNRNDFTKKGPRVDIIRGGLEKHYVVLRLSTFNKKIDVDIILACQKKLLRSLPHKDMSVVENLLLHYYNNVANSTTDDDSPSQSLRSEYSDDDYYLIGDFYG